MQPPEIDSQIENESASSEDEDKQGEPQGWVKSLLDSKDPRTKLKPLIELRQSKRSEKQNKVQTDYALMMDVLKIEEPNSFEESQHDPQRKKAMQVEFVSNIKNDTCDLVDRSQKCEVIGTKWVYRVKYKSTGVLDKYKTRRVAKGFAQVESFDFQDTFSPIAKLTTIRTPLVVATHNKWQVLQMDIKLAFLNGLLKEEVYVEQPPGFLVPSYEDKVCKLKKALYRLKQAS
ncbi:hypothetical protein L7F22_022720 [Adiantum nelumboides]|nr:hypothetical protein [Adiantum nelumboides]